MAFCLQHSLALSAGLFVKTIETTPDVLVWKLDRSQGLLEHDIHMRLKGHEGQVINYARAFILCHKKKHSATVVTIDVLIANFL